MDECLVQFLSERLLLAANGSGYRDPQSDIVLRDSLNWRSPSGPFLWRSGNPVKRGKKHCSSQRGGGNHENMVR